MTISSSASRVASGPLRTPLPEAPVPVRRMLVALLAAGVATFAELYAVQGVLPELSRDLGVGAGGAALTVSAATTGLAIGVFAWTWIADRIGRLTCMRIAVVLAVALSVVSSLVPDFTVLLILRAATGMVLGAVPVLAVAYVHESLTGARAAAAVTAYIAGTTIGGAAGRLIAGPLVPVLGWRGALLAVAGISLASGVAFLVLAPSGARPSPSRRPQLPRILRALRTPQLIRINLQGLLLTGCFVAVFNFLAFRLEAPPFLIAPALASLLFAAYFFGTVTSRLAGRWIPVLGSARTALLGITTMFVGLAVMVLDSLPAIVAGLVIFTGGHFLAHATATATTGMAAEADFRAQASGLYTICFYVGSGIGGWALGLVFEHCGWIAMSGVITAVLLTVALVIGVPAALRRSR